MRGYLVLGLAALAMLAVVAVRDGAPPAEATHGNLNVHVHDDYYHPAGAFGVPTSHALAMTSCQKAQPDAACDAQIHIGDTITWVAPAPFAVNLHSVTECVDNTFSTCGPAVMPSNPIGDTGVLAPGSWPTAPVLFTQTGTYYYTCTVHPSVMRGRVVVQNVGSPTPIPAPGDPVVGGIAGLTTDTASEGNDVLLYAAIAAVLGLSAVGGGLVAVRRRIDR